MTIREHNEAHDLEQGRKSKVRKFIEGHFEIVKFLFEMYKNKKLKTLYDGMSSSIMCSVVTNGVYFCSYKFWYRMLDILDLKVEKVRDSITTSLLSAICTALISNPIYVLNSRMSKPKSEVNSLLL